MKEELVKKSEKLFIKKLDVLSKIKEKEQRVRTIDLIASGCGISCKVTAAKRGSFNSYVAYTSSNKDEIIRLLHVDKEKIIEEITSLKKQFAEL